MQELKYKICRAKIFCPGVEAGKKYCPYRSKGQRSKDRVSLSRETNTIFPALRSR